MQEIKKIRYHAAMSLAKSIIRILGFLALVVSIPFGVILLIIAEIVGILEEKDDLGL